MREQLRAAARRCRLPSLELDRVSAAADARVGDAPDAPSAKCASGHHALSADQEVELATDGSVATKWCIIHEGKPVVWEIDAGSVTVFGQSAP